MNPSPTAFPPSSGQNGFLAVRVRTAGDVLPVVGASVTVLPAIGSDTPEAGAGAILLTTDRSGNTPAIPLPSVSPEASRSPGGEPVASYYHLLIHARGFAPYAVYELPIFPDVTALQYAHLFPSTDQKP